MVLSDASNAAVIDSATSASDAKSLTNPTTLDLSGVSTTLIVISVIHLFYWYHWMRKTSKRKLLVSYKTLIQKKHYYKAFLAVLFHPPTQHTGNSSPTRNHSPTTQTQQQQYQNLFCRLWDIYRQQRQQSSCCHGRHLSGFPLLLYNSHILWTCRALEGETSSSLSYARFLWALISVALALDLILTFTVLNTLRDMHYATSSPFLLGAQITSSATRSSIPRQLEHHLTNRSIGSITMLTSALLVVFRHQFPHVPIQVLPFGLQGSGDDTIVESNAVGEWHHDSQHYHHQMMWMFWLVPWVSYCLCIIILFLLLSSHSINPLASIGFGTASGILWTNQLTSFLQQPYWSNGLIMGYGILCLLSLKATGSKLLPCIEYVGWDVRGRLRRTLSNNDQYEEGMDDPYETIITDAAQEEALYRQNEMSRVSSIVDTSSDDDDSNHSDNDEEVGDMELAPEGRTNTNNGRNQLLPFFVGNHHRAVARQNSDLGDDSRFRHRLPFAIHDLDEEDVHDEENDGIDRFQSGGNENDEERYPLLRSSGTASGTMMRSRRTTVPTTPSGS